MARFVTAGHTWDAPPTPVARMRCSKNRDASGTVTVVSDTTFVWHASRSPSASSSASSRRRSVAFGSEQPSRTSTRHLPHVPRPPHGVSMMIPARAAASRTMLPDRTYAALPSGSNVTLIVLPIATPALLIEAGTEDAEPPKG